MPNKLIAELQELLQEKMDPTNFLKTLRQALDRQGELLTQLSKVVPADVEEMDADDRQKLARLFSDLRKQSETAHTTVNKMGAFFAWKDLVTLPPGTSGWS